jgi:hypothetical protein
MPRPLELVLGGWKTAGVWTIHDGFPLAFIMSNGGSPIPTYGAQRPNLTGTAMRNGGPESSWVNQYFANVNPGAGDFGVFSDPGPYTLGNAPRTIGSVRSPFFFSANLSVGKEFRLSTSHEEMKLELRLEADNAFNHPVFGTPDTFVGDQTFGQIGYTAVGARQCQLALKFNF